MKILVIGSGGREHALVWKISRSPLVKQIYTAPGNGGTARTPKNRNLDIKATELEKLCDFAKGEKIDLTVVGPEDPLSMGIVDLFSKKGLKIFGPTKYAAMLESSKGFAKNFMKENGVPTPDFKIFDDYEKCLSAIPEETPPIVLKADGLALGKGVKICMSHEEARQELNSIMRDKSLGDAGNIVILDKFIKGFEVSYLALSDGEHLLPLATSQDNKRLLDGDRGPNTGGMGVVSPIPEVDKKMEKRIMRETMERTIQGMAERGHPFRGVLYAGLIFDGGNPLALEFNARFGDPETQPLLFRMKSDIVPLLMASADGNLSGMKIEWDERYAVCVVIASGGYPGDYRKGLPVSGPLDMDEDDDDAMIFHAGTILKDGKIFTNGGRVFGVCVKDRDVKKAKIRAIEIAEQVKFEDAQFRRDIGDKIL